jgi:hypothetical protein
MSKSLFAPHMAILSVIGGFDLNSPSGLQQLNGVAKAIPLMKLTPDHVTQTASALDREIQKIQTGGATYSKAAIKSLATARDDMIKHNAHAQNGAGTPAAATQMGGETARPAAS